MLLKKVQPTPKVHLTCVRCRKRTTSYQAWADVEGTPFVDYYCSTCSAKLEAWKDTVATRHADLPLMRLATEET